MEEKIRFYLEMQVDQNLPGIALASPLVLLHRALSAPEEAPTKSYMIREIEFVTDDADTADFFFGSPL